jgi:hypothetical protein
MSCCAMTQRAFGTSDPSPSRIAPRLKNGEFICEHPDEEPSTYSGGIGLKRTAAFDEGTFLNSTGTVPEPVAHDRNRVVL